MRVLQVCDHYPPDAGGLATHVQRLSHHLNEAGHEVSVVVAGQNDDATDDAFPVRRVSLSLARLPGVYEPSSPQFHPPWPDPAFRRGLGKVVEEFDPDVIHAHGWCVFTAASCAKPWSGRVVSTLHDHGLACPKKSLLRAGNECQPARGIACLTCDEQTVIKRGGLAAALATTTPWLARRVRRLFAVSSYVARRAEQAGISPELLEVVPNFVDLPDQLDDLEAPAEPAGRYMLYAGPAAPHKGRQVLIEAFGRLDADIQLCLLGGDGTASAPGLLDLGYRRGGSMWSFYRHALALVVPSIWPDPCPTVALEAMSWGTPVIASAVGGLTDIVDDGVTGLLVSPGDPDALRDALARLIDDANLRSAMGRQARQRAERFSVQAVLPALEAAYHRISADSESGRKTVAPGVDAHAR